MSSNKLFWFNINKTKEVVLSETCIADQKQHFDRKKLNNLATYNINSSFSFFSVICYELASQETLANFLKEKRHKLTEEAVYIISCDIIEAIDFLSSKNIVHYAILPENINLLHSSEV